jgi:peptide deformylase
MALREVIKMPNLNLRREAHKVSDFGQNFQKLVDDMIDTMRDEPGVGLAAPQVNVPLRLIIVEYPEDDTIEDAESQLFIVANPKIKKQSEKTVMGIEGCLSVPNLVGNVERNTGVIVEGLNREGAKQTIRADGWLARVFQHEIDHIHGVLFVDRATELFEPQQLETEISSI